MPHTSALPGFYWLVFGWYEPLLCSLSFIGALVNPKQIHDMQAPWPSGAPPEHNLARATLVTVVQLAHTIGLLGFINFFLLLAVRRHLLPYPALQEKVVAALLTPLLFGDVFHLAITFWMLGEKRWDQSTWTASPVLFTTVVTGMSLLLPRAAWHLGIGRYVHKRDGIPGIKRV